MQRRHQKLDTAVRVHFLSHDVFHFPEYSPTEWQIGINARCKLANKTTAQEQRVAFVIGFNLTECWCKKLRLSHESNVPFKDVFKKECAPHFIKKIALRFYLQ
jgi:hypothetical protein